MGIFKRKTSAPEKRLSAAELLEKDQNLEELNQAINKMKNLDERDKEFSKAHGRKVLRLRTKDALDAL